MRTPGTPGEPACLPIPRTRVIGREREAADLRALLAGTSHRIVTVTGPGGVGKTRLALSVAEALRAGFDDDVAFVPLSSISDCRLVLPAIARACGLLSDLADRHEADLFGLLRDRRALILLDNCEHIPDIHLPVAALLAGCPRMTILATSQAPIGIAGEQLYPLAALPVPPPGEEDPEAILRADAVSLFVERARAVNPRLAVDAGNAGTIAEICRHLEGLPLAIELAAARTNVLSPAALLARLSHRLDVLGGEHRDGPDRLGTMREAIGWSYDLLSPEEQAFFRRLCVFAETFSLGAAEAIFDPASSGRAAIDLLGTLVDRSLVRRVPGSRRSERYLILRMLRGHGLEQLEALGEEATARLAHAEVMTRIAEAAEPHLVMPDRDTWFDRLDEDRGNVRAAVEWSLANGQEALVFRIAGSIWRFCAERGLVTECRVWLDAALAAQGNHLTPHRTTALIGAGYLAEDQRDLDAAQRFFTQARHLAAAIGDSLNECRALIGLGTVAHDRNDFRLALDLHYEALTMARAANDSRCIAVTLTNLGAVSSFLGRPEEALRHWDESRAYLAGIGDQVSEAITLMNTGALLYQMGEYARAETYHQRALALQRQLNLQRDIPFTLMNLGEAALMLGDLTLAHDAIAEAISRFRELGASESLGSAYNGRARIALVEDKPVEAAACVLESMHHLAGQAEGPIVIENGELLAEICARRGMHAAAVELVRATGLARDRLGVTIYAPRRAALDEVSATARASLDPTALAAAVTAGEALAPDALSRRITSIAREVIGQHREPDRGGPAPAALAEAHHLTAREVEVLTLLAQGQSTQQIADALFVSPRTAATHINNILGKLGVNSRTAAVAHAMRLGLV